MSSLRYHAYTLYLFSCSDLASVLALSLFFGGSSSLAASQLGMGPSLSIRQVLGSTPAMALWIWSNLLLCNLHNQRHEAAMAEDRANKPWRPLVAGRITQPQVARLTYAMYAVVLAVSGAVGGTGPCVVLALVCLWYNEGNGASRPWLKNLLTGLGWACFFAGPLEVATRSSVVRPGSGDMRALAWLLMLAGAISTTSHAQDFRDAEGDAASGRSTLPLCMGDAKARALLTVGIIGWTAACSWFWRLHSADHRWPPGGTLASLAGLVVVSAFWRDRSPGGDRTSYSLYPLWVAALFVMPARI